MSPIFSLISINIIFRQPVKLNRSSPNDQLKLSHQNCILGGIRRFEEPTSVVNFDIKMQVGFAGLRIFPV
jgi:hypothetical protein